MGNGEELEINKDDVQPDKAVVAEAEIAKDKPLSEDIEQTELYVDDDGDQEKPKTNMSQEQAYAAFRKEQEKRKSKNKQLEQEKNAREEIERELKELKSTVGKMAKGQPPTLESCDYDEEEFQSQTKAYYVQPGQKVESKEETKDQTNKTAEEADFYLFQKEQDLTKSMSGYGEAKNSLIQTLESKHGVSTPDILLSSLSDIARQANVDIAKAIVAMDKVPSLIDEIKSTNGNHIAIAKVLEKAAGKVKTRTKKHVDTIPEPDINNSGPIDSKNATIGKARQKWVDEPTTANYKAYQKAKTKKVNENV